MFDELYTLNFWNSSNVDFKKEFNILYGEQAKKWGEVQKRLFEVWQSDKFVKAYQQSGKSDKLTENAIKEQLEKEAELWKTKK